VRFTPWRPAMSVSPLTYTEHPAIVPAECPVYCMSVGDAKFMSALDEILIAVSCELA
jgi:hypothetical protein